MVEEEEGVAALAEVGVVASEAEIVAHLVDLAAAEEEEEGVDLVVVGEEEVVVVEVEEVVMVQTKSSLKIKSTFPDSPVI
jgi:hypothetical protein